MKGGIVGIVFPVEGTRKELEKAVSGLETVNYIDIWANFLQVSPDGLVNRGKITIYGTETVLKMLKKTDIEEIKIKVWQEEAYSNGDIYQMTYSKAIIKAADDSIFSNALNFSFFRKQGEGVLRQFNYRINDRKATLRQFMELNMEEVVVFDLDGPLKGPDITTVIVYTKKQEGEDL